MKIALAQINPTVGDIAGNVRKIKTFAQRAKKAGAELAVFPELCITGYPPRDLVEHASFIDRKLRAVHELAAASRDMALLVGFVDRNPRTIGNRFCNAAALLAGGKVAAV